jgi:hypothetical protein
MPENAFNMFIYNELFARQMRIKIFRHVNLGSGKTLSAGFIKMNIFWYGDSHIVIILCHFAALSTVVH